MAILDLALRSIVPSKSGGSRTLGSACPRNAPGPTYAVYPALRRRDPGAGHLSGNRLARGQYRPRREALNHRAAGRSQRPWSPVWSRCLHASPDVRRLVGARRPGSRVRLRGGSRLAAPTSPLVLLEATRAQFTELRPHRAVSLDLSCGYYAEQEQVSDVIASSVPAKPIATCAGRETVLSPANATLVPLDDMIDLPVSIHFRGPAATVELQAIAAEMAVAAGLVEYFAHSCLPHEAVPITNGALSAAQLGGHANRRALREQLGDQGLRQGP